MSHISRCLQKSLQRQGQKDSSREHLQGQSRGAACGSTGLSSKGTEYENAY
jgi:hypothetical protein